MLDVFEAMTIDERRVVYSVALACGALGVLGGCWFGRLWAQLARSLLSLAMWGALAAAVWFFFVREPRNERYPGNLTNASTPTAQPPLMAAPAAPPPPTATPTTGAWWE